ncbi:hypothetical protein L195_g052424 [Trifolium pratense]|uniref:Uncharacterized protein n=1 Tax=Trifolium pratense TaxID=57577 RepID=A0A2K3K517_TRIPR|nr:hypothetical protein L195_g052424 [Trifolium pratense]
MKPQLKVGLAFGLGTMFGIVMSRGARFHCHKAAMLGHHPNRTCRKQPHSKETAAEVDVAKRDEATLLKND